MIEAESEMNLGFFLHSLQFRQKHRPEWGNDRVPGSGLPDSRSVCFWECQVYHWVRDQRGKRE